MENGPTEQNPEEKKTELTHLLAQIDKDLEGLNKERDAEKIQRWQEQREKIKAEIDRLNKE